MDSQGVAPPPYFNNTSRHPTGQGALFGAASAGIVAAAAIAVAVVLTKSRRESIFKLFMFKARERFRIRHYTAVTRRTCPSCNSVLTAFGALRGGWKSGVHPVISCAASEAELILRTVKQEPARITFLEGQCGQPGVCPLSKVKAGSTVCIKELLTSPDLRARLREMGMCEKQRIKLLTRDSNYICQVCNARLGISHKLAEAIFVEHVAPVKR